MDHIWGAPSRLKKSLALIFLKKSAFILRQEFLNTLYIVLISPEVEILPLDNHLPDSFLNQLKIISDLKLICSQSCGHIEAFGALRSLSPKVMEHTVVQNLISNSP